MGGKEAVPVCESLTGSRAAPYGYLVVNNFGFEYTETIEGQTITKRQIGTAPLIVQCLNNYN